MYICYAYAIDAMAAGRDGVLYLMSTPAQTFDEYEVWYYPGPPAAFVIVFSKSSIDYKGVSMLGVVMSQQRNMRQHPRDTYVLHVDAT